MKKLQLNKKTIASLSKDSLSNVKGGGPTGGGECATYGCDDTRRCDLYTLDCHKYTDYCAGFTVLCEPR